jgi:hypothetical protein
MRTVDVTDALQQYLDGLVAPRDPLLARIEDEAHRDNVPIVDPHEGRDLQVAHDERLPLPRAAREPDHEAQRRRICTAPQRLAEIRERRDPAIVVELAAPLRDERLRQAILREAAAFRGDAKDDLETLEAASTFASSTCSTVSVRGDNPARVRSL